MWSGARWDILCACSNVPSVKRKVRFPIAQRAPRRPGSEVRIIYGTLHRTIIISKIEKKIDDFFLFNASSRVRARVLAITALRPLEKSCARCTVDHTTVTKALDRWVP